MPKYHQWRENALKITHVIKTPHFYISYGALQEAARALEVAKTFKHHKEAVPKMEAALKVAMNRYVAAFENELKNISYDPLITDEPECARHPTSDSLLIQMRANTMATFANYWPDGPTDLPSLMRIERLSFWPAMSDTGIKEIRDSSQMIEALLERHLRIRAVELHQIATTKTPRDAWRDAKHLIDEYHIETGEAASVGSQSLSRSVTALAQSAIREAFQNAPMGNGYKDHILAIASRIKIAADTRASRLKDVLLEEEDGDDGEERPSALFIRAIR